MIAPLHFLAIAALGWEEYSAPLGLVEMRHGERPPARHCAGSRLAGHMTENGAATGAARSQGP